MSAPLPVPIVLFGAGGRMGREAAAVIRDDPGCALVRAVDSASHPDLGRPLTDVRGRSAAPPLEGSLDGLPPDAVVIDFSLPAGFRRLAAALIRSPRPLVTGTTGLGPDDETLLAELAKSAPVLHAPNMSVGVAAVRAAAAMLTRALGESFDVEVLEIHHSAKKDAPSGTALALGREVVRARGGTAALADRGTSARTPGQVGVAALRGGAVVGEHTVFFLGQDERVELTHRASSRGLFARGAVRAAKWIAGRPPGRYAIDDVLSATLRP